MFIPIEEALQRYHDGEMLILVDDENRENEGDLVISAEKVTPYKINFMREIKVPFFDLRIPALQF